jgi:hypothetical protein
LEDSRVLRASLARCAGALAATALHLPGSAAAAALPACLAPAGGQTIEETFTAAPVPDPEVLQRLAYAEGRSTGFPDDPLVYRAIAWGVMNRVRLAAASPAMRRQFGSGIPGVVFRKGQFNPAVSSRSPFSKDFLCPRDPQGWRHAEEAATEALDGKGNPFLATDWERETGLSLVVNFYYPASVQAKGPLAPWEGSRSLVFVGDVRVGEGVLPAERVRFYRLAAPPRDVAAAEGVR